MKKVWKMFSALLLVGLLFTGCTPKEDKAQEQSGAPIIDYEVPDKVNDYGFDYEFVPESE
ncbi:MULTISPECIES: hypothetical protein [Clostridia]|jgi:lipoprotein|uniref:hypothetical protein n=1 Tax=Clostridia TaxID=186801 RepID=UPI00189ADD3A|nr:MULTISPECIES: hypothetical protein [Clostridia]